VSGEQLAVLQGAFTAEFSPDGSRILTGSYDGEAHVYDGVPWQARFRERATLEPEALRILQTLEPACPSLTEAVHRIRDDGDLDAPMRHAVMDLVRRRVSEATAWIRDLRERMGLREDILAAVNADTVRHPWVRELAQRYAATLEDDPSDLNNAAWRTAGSPGHSVEEYRSALRAAQAAVAALPDNWYYVNTLGVAQYRCALFAEALTTLARSVELAGEVRPPDLVFLAMARFRLGQVDAARADLARLRELLQGSEDKQQRTLLSEAEALIGE
jgi:tetratricopeptide (TPR) repeat protein